MVSLQGECIFTGFACGRVFVLRHGVPDISHERTSCAQEADSELRKYEEARKVVSDQLHALMKQALSNDESTILEAQSFMLSDPEYMAAIRSLITKEHLSAPAAVESASSHFIQTMSQVNASLFKENISDIQDIASRLIAALTEERPADLRSLTEKSVVIADTLLPSELLSADRSLISAICMDRGGSASHVAILARAMGIPCITALNDGSLRASTGTYAALDASRGILWLDPDEETVHRVLSLKEDFRKEHSRLISQSTLPAVTTDGVEIRLECNLESLDDVPQALTNGARGAGLFRTEFLVLEQGRICSEDEQTEIYSTLAQQFRDHGQVTIRTFDIGSDKVLKGHGVREANPALGCRAVRFLMAHKDIFRSQLRAILRSSAGGGVRVMFPMVSGPDELDEVLSFFETVKSECRQEGIVFDEGIKAGVMIEVPSAALTSDALASRVSFFSAGTNDLTQYTLAADRTNEKTCGLYKEYHPAVLRLLKFTADAAERNGISVSMCGEMAAQERLIPLAAGLGYRTLSMNPSSLPDARKVIRHMNYAACQALAKKALGMTNCRDIEKILDEFYERLGN